MSHTNVTIKDHLYSREFEQKKRIASLEWEVGYLRQQAEYCQGLLENIPRAIEEWGHVDLFDDRGNKIMTIVKQKEQDDADE